MQIKLLTDEQLEALPTHRLLGVLDSARAVESSEQRRLKSEHVCCEECMEWMLSAEDYKKQVIIPTRWITIYKEKIKSILAMRKNLK